MITTKAEEKIHEFERFGNVLGLERMNKILELLGNPHEDLKIIHVAGTNGKGSTCRYMYSVLQEAGYKTGLYTSPFLEKFNERIEFNGQCISDEDLSCYTDRVLAQVERMTEICNQKPTEFEVITAIALLYFKEKNCDYVILEVGLGGIGDSTNVCQKPLASVITSVSMDHMDRLGNTIEDIAREKAGIIKEACPVITSVRNEKALEIIRETAKKKNCPYMETAKVEVNIHKETLDGMCFDALNLSNLEISMTGRHQAENATLAVATLLYLDQEGKIDVSRDVLYKGLKKAKQHGRFEVLSDMGNRPVIIIDGAHNIDGAEALKNAVNSLCPDGRILLVTGMLKDKDYEGIIGQFLEITGDFIVTEPQNPRKLLAEELSEVLIASGARSAVPRPKPEDAVNYVNQIKSDYDAVIFAGSLYLIGEIRSMLKNA